MKDAYSPEEIRAMLDRIAKLEEALRECLPHMRVFKSTGFIDKKSEAAREKAKSLLS